MRCCARARCRRATWRWSPAAGISGHKSIDAPLRTDLRVGGERTVKVDAQRQGGADRIQADRALWRPRLAARGASSIPGARTRSACTPPIAAIRCWATRSMAIEAFNARVRDARADSACSCTRTACRSPGPSGREQSFSAPLAAGAALACCDHACRCSRARARPGAAPSGQLRSPSGAGRAPAAISGRPISARRILADHAREQTDAQSFAAKAAGAVERLLGGDIALDFRAAAARENTPWWYRRTACLRRWRACSTATAV